LVAAIRFPRFDRCKPNETYPFQTGGPVLNTVMPPEADAGQLSWRILSIGVTTPAGGFARLVAYGPSMVDVIMDGDTLLEKAWRCIQ
jgi:hypothetical protein